MTRYDYDTEIEKDVEIMTEVDMWLCDISVLSVSLNKIGKTSIWREDPSSFTALPNLALANNQRPHPTPTQEKKSITITPESEASQPAKHAPTRSRAELVTTQIQTSQALSVVAEGCRWSGASGRTTTENHEAGAHRCAPAPAARPWRRHLTPSRRRKRKMLKQASKQARYVRTHAAGLLAHASLFGGRAASGLFPAVAQARDR
ncbi:uncharacterized protein K452DRAFT_39703 [Aplosporella prunicola CBS 121167]|uniref:Uncharacterized protein n=1 Tax=Aplosporella prunicola CBS 121167 TaxID=1176127 RepID=A0A6A6BDK7_9PEZI|nr:uncharacterized protein K452DRAFT_39703 [Aplosporella prunicola CBS 121167]KAF2141453.1 hypothetical protein K452DRAFT_39703 [Aplosporella prunicola CBS 121167]